MNELNCFDSLKNPIPCVPVSVGEASNEFLLFVIFIGLILGSLMVRRMAQKLKGE